MQASSLRFVAMMLTTQIMAASQSTTSRARPAQALRWSAMAAVALLAACATPPQSQQSPINKYVSPAGVPVAKLAMRASLSGGVDLYGVYVLSDGENCKQPQIAGAGRTVSNAPPSVNLEAGKWTTLEFITFHPSKMYCVVRWSFQPTAGRTYVVAGNGVGTACSARVLDATNPDSIKPEATAVRRNIPGNACVSLTVAQAARNGKTDSGQGGAGKDEAALRPGASADDLKGLIPQ
jgi:hypothetical protein